MKTENQRKRAYKNGVTIRYYICLKELHHQITNNELSNIESVCTFYKVSRGIPSFLQSAKIIKKLGQGSYKWIGEKPTVEMAETIIELARLKSLQYEKKEKVKEIENDEPVVKILNASTEVKEQKKNWSFSIFWGLIKFKKD